MSADHEEIWRRLLPEHYHEVLCTRYHLKDFLGDTRGRRDRYFGIVSDGPAILAQVLPYRPDERDVVSWIAFVLGKDRTFLGFISKHGGADEALEPESWSRVLEAAAGAVCGEFLIKHSKARLV